jgi:hypothetical protein
LDKGLIDSVIWYLLAVDSNKNAAISGFFEKNEKEKKPYYRLQRPQKEKYNRKRA